MNQTQDRRMFERYQAVKLTEAQRAELKGIIADKTPANGFSLFDAVIFTGTVPTKRCLSHHLIFQQILPFRPPGSSDHLLRFSLHPSR